MVNFKSTGSKLGISVSHSGYPEAEKLKFATIDLLGLNALPKNFTVDGVRLPAGNIKYNGTTKVNTII